MINTHLKHLIPISLSALLIACGSGGGKGDNHQQPASQTSKESSKASPQANLIPNKEKTVEVTSSIIKQTKPTDSILNTPSAEAVVTPSLTTKEIEKQTAPTLNKPGTEKVISPALTAKEPEKPATPILNKPSTETVFTPPLTAKEPEKQTTPTLNKPSTETIVAPTLEDKEQEISSTPDAENLASSESIKNSETTKPLDIPTEINKLTNTWFAGGNSEYSKDGVRVYKLIENDRNYADDPNFKEKKLEYIQLKQGTNSSSDYTLTLLDDNVYYGFYRDSIDMFKVDNHYVYSFNERAENKGDLSQLTATYRGRFIYSLRSNPNLATSSDVHLTYSKGQAEGKIYSRQVKNGEQGRELFDIKTNNGDLRLLELNPLVPDLDNSIHGEEVVVRKNSPDRIILETHFINGQEGTENKHIVGKGGNEKYWGVLGAGKVEE